MRVQAMVDVVVGPPPDVYALLMQREMTDPSEAMPVIVKEFIRPMMDELDRHRGTARSRATRRRGHALRVQHRRPGALLSVRDAGRAAHPGRAPLHARAHGCRVRAHRRIQPGRPRRGRDARCTETSCGLTRSPRGAASSSGSCWRWDAGRRGCSRDPRATAAGARSGAATSCRRARPPPRVALDPEAPPPEPENVTSPLSLTDALALATSGNRRIAEADRERRCRCGARARHARPAAPGHHRLGAVHVVHRSALRNAVALPAGLVPGATNPSFVIREQQSGRLNGATVVPLDVTGELWKTLTAAQAGYRGERARVWATTLDAAGRRHPRLLRPARGASGCARSSSRTIALDREQLANAEQRYDAGRLTKNELLVVQVALQDARAGAAAARPRDRSGALRAERGDRPPGRRADRGRRRAPSVPIAARRSTTRCATPIANNPVAARAGRGAATARRRPRPRSRAAACRASRAAAPSTDSSERSSQPQRIGVGLRRLHVGPRHRRPARGAARRGAHRGRAQSPRASSASCASSRAPCAPRSDAAAERLAALDTARAAVGQAEENLRIRAAAVRRRPRHQRGRARRPGACSRSSARRSPPRSTRRTPAAPSCRS